MSGRLTKVSLDVDNKSLTDWERLTALTDAEIDAAISNDPDSFTLNANEIARFRQVFPARSRVRRELSEKRSLKWSGPLRRSEVRRLLSSRP